MSETPLWAPDERQPVLSRLIGNDHRPFANHPLNPGRAPDGYQWGLPLLYLVWAIVIVILYFPCRWFAGYKARNKSPWLSYL